MTMPERVMGFWMTPYSIGRQSITRMPRVRIALEAS